MGIMPEGKLLASMATPMMISMLVQACYNIVDSIFVSQLGENALNAVSLAFPMQQIMIAVCGGTTVGMNALLSRALGAKNIERANKIANTGIFLAICISIVFALIGLLVTKPFFLAQTDVEEIVNYGTQYTMICMVFSFGIVGQFCFEKLLQSTGRTLCTMITH